MSVFQQQLKTYKEMTLFTTYIIVLLEFYPSAQNSKIRYRERF